MSIKKFTSVISFIFILGVSPIFSQFKQIEGSENTGEKIEIEPIHLPHLKEALDKPSFDFGKLTQLSTSQIKHSIFPVAYDGEMAIAFKGYLDSQKGLSIEEQIDIYLNRVSIINDLRGEMSYSVTKTDIDEKGRIHILVQQTVGGIEIEGAELKLHTKEGLINYANGRLKDVPTINTSGIISSEKALEIVLDSYREKGIYQEIKEDQRFLVPAVTEKSDLVVREMDNESKLVYRVKAYANIQQEFTYYIDAKSGEILESFKNFCSLHHHMGDGWHTNDHKTPVEKTDYNSLTVNGPATATALDLSNTNRTINTYEVDGIYYMIDASRDMFNNSASLMPNEPVGVIWTVDGQNTNPQNNDFDYDHVKSNNNSWASKISVSAHYNGGEAFTYFEDTHNRNSINNEGGNIISLINISDPETGGGFDNAFWNGAALFYGNGNQAFTPLAEGLDVAGHEMSHGVVQATANLTYQGESGALNEAFADIFGAMIDRDDWLIGEEIVKTAVFPSGAMRDMSDPHNGGSSLNDTGYQPKNVSEQYTGSQDNGGVHINSGIVNHAYYLFAETSGVGKNKAEQIFYRALNVYLTKSSNFKDMRAAAEQATQDFIDDGIYNTNVLTAVSAAFGAVGIGEGGGTTDYETDVDMNPGEDFLLSSSQTLSELLLRNNALELIGDPLVNVSHISKPSVTDNGENIFFVGEDKNIYAININWDTGEVTGDAITTQAIWRNVAVSKDGSKLAALTDMITNEIVIFNLENGTDKTFTLYNPTFADDGTTTGDVDFADVMEFDFTGEWLIYDAQSTIDGGSNGTISYWDISFINVFNNSSGNFTDGQIQKLFSQLPENTSVGNPTFSKNSPYIIAFDLIENSDYSVMGANIEANEVNPIYSNSILGYPNFNNADNQLVYESGGFFGNSISLSALDDSKINATIGSHVELIDDERFPVVFSNGEREIVDVEEATNSIAIKISPNPIQDIVSIDWGSENITELTVYSIDGKLILSKRVNGNGTTINMDAFEKGTYLIELSGEEIKTVKQVIKQ